MFEFTIPSFIKILNQTLTWLDKAEAHATTKKYEANNLLQMRLAPDMFPLVRQLQISTDVAKGVAGRLTGGEPPVFEDKEATLEELRGRITKTIGYLKEFNPKQFENFETRQVKISYMPGKYLEGKDYLLQTAIPNFYFHTSMAYAILRHNGIELGKSDYLGTVNYKDL